MTPECLVHGGKRVRHPEEILDRCCDCGHRTITDGLIPKSSRRITLKRPWYPVIELYRRHWAIKEGQIR